MPGPAVDVIRTFGAVESDQRYTRLVELFADDAVYYDPFFGPQRGKAAIGEFMTHMESIMPSTGVRFDEWEVEADRTVAWARWTMWVPGSEGTPVAIPGQSLYRLDESCRVTYAADYVDSIAYRKLRPGKASPDAGSAAGWSIDQRNIDGPAVDVVRQFWAIQEAARYAELGALFAPDAVFTDRVYGRFEGHDAVVGYLRRMEAEMPAMGVRFELVDAAGDETVAWSQWWCHFPTGSVPGWTLHTVRDGLLTLDADYFDVVAAQALSS